MALFKVTGTVTFKVEQVVEAKDAREARKLAEGLWFKRPVFGGKPARPGPFTTQSYLEIMWDVAEPMPNEEAREEPTMPPPIPRTGVLAAVRRLAAAGNTRPTAGDVARELVGLTASVDYCDEVFDVMVALAKRGDLVTVETSGVSCWTLTPQGAMTHTNNERG